MIVCDEISSLKEIEAMKNGFLSGAAFAVSVHAGSMRQLMNKKLLHDLVDTGEFEYIVFLKNILMSSRLRKSAHNEIRRFAFCECGLRFRGCFCGA